MSTPGPYGTTARVGAAPHHPGHVAMANAIRRGGMLTAGEDAMRRTIAVAVTLLVCAGCGDDSGADGGGALDGGALDGGAERCAVGTASGCAADLVCAAVVGAEPACFAPVEIKGRIFDAVDGTGVSAASIEALDARGGAVSEVASSERNGGYVLPLVVQRSSDGAPLAGFVTLRVSAAGYQRFPIAPEVAPPIDLGEAVTSGGSQPFVIMSAQTEVGLVPLAADGG